MASTDAPDSAAEAASRTLSCLRSHEKKIDLVLETLARQGDIVPLENKVLMTQTEILTVLHRLDQRGSCERRVRGAIAGTGLIETDC